MFFDWNGNGRKDDTFDNFMDLTMMDQMEKEEKKRREESSENNTGRCLLALAVLPVALIAALLTRFQ